MQWVLDAKGSVSHRSREWLDFTGLDAADAGAQRRFGTIHADDSIEAERLFARAHAGRSAFLVKHRLRQGRGGFAWVLSGGAPARSPIDGSFLGYLGSTEPLDQAPLDQVVIDVLDASYASRSQRSVRHLDSIADHVMLARRLAERNGNARIARSLDLVLILIGDKLQEFLSDRRLG